MDSTRLKIVVLDEPERLESLFGTTFTLLGVEPIHVNSTDYEAIIDSKPNVILLSREWSYEWRIVAAEASKADIPVIYVMDGVIEWSYVWNNLSFVQPEGTVLQPLIADALCVIGQHPARILASLGLADRIHIVGLPRFDAYPRTRRIDQNSPPKIVISTAKTYGHNVEQKVMVKQAIMDLKQWFSSNIHINVVWRIDDDLARELRIITDNSGSFSEHLETAAGLISFSSTCLLEGMLKGIPTALIDYRASPQYVQTAWDIRSKHHIHPVVQELLYPPHNKIALQEFCLADELECGCIPAAKRLADVIMNVIESKSKNAPMFQKNEIYGKIDYHQIHSQLSTFSLSPKALLQYELDAALNLLKFYTIESKRLTSELDEARANNSNLDILARERQETISALNELATERQNTIEMLSSLLEAKLAK